MGCMVLRRYREEYRSLAQRAGLRLASEDNPLVREKSWA